MKIGTKALLFALVTLLIPAASVSAYFFVGSSDKYTAGAKNEMAEESHAAGLKVGRRLSRQACLKEAVVRAGNKTLEVRTGIPWLYGCLESAKPDATFCKGIQPPSERADYDKQLKICRARGIHEYCLYYMPTVEQFCHSPDARA